MTKLRNRLADLSYRLETAQQGLSQVADLSTATAAAVTERFGRLDGASWLAMILDRRASFEVLHRQLGELEIEAQRQLAGATDRLGKLRPEALPLPGSREYEDLTRQVREVEDLIHDAKDVLRALSGRRDADNAFHEALTEGSRRTAVAIVEIESRRALQACAAKVREMSSLARGLLESVEAYQRLTEIAAQFARTEIPAPRLVLPESGAWRKIAGCGEPRLETAAPSKDAA